MGRTFEVEYPDPDVQGFNPCAEQSLANFETCCLAEIYLPNIESYDELLKVARYLYRINKHSLAIKCAIKETEDIVHKNMRMGIGVTGYLQATEEQRSWLDGCYNYIRNYDKEYSRLAGFPASIKLTTVKPSERLVYLLALHQELTQDTANTTLDESACQLIAVWHMPPGSTGTLWSTC